MLDGKPFPNRLPLPFLQKAQLPRRGSRKGHGGPLHSSPLGGALPHEDSHDNFATLLRHGGEVAPVP
jgi:hypothetical protein